MTQRPDVGASASNTLVVFGGSFDPPHIAHAMAVLFALSTMPEATVLVVPTFRHALDKRFSASFAHRLRMCELAMADLPRTEISDIERELGGPSRTLNTLQVLNKRHPGVTLRLLIGADILSERDRWYRFDEVTRLAAPLVVGRPGHASSASLVLPDITSTTLRDDLRKGRKTDDRIARRVLDMIEEKHLYREIC